MANIPGKREDWEALSDGDRQSIINALQKAASLGKGDTIEPVEKPQINMQPAAADPACVQECDDIYEQAVQYCNSLALLQARAICFGTAATDPGLLLDGGVN